MFHPSKSLRAPKMLIHSKNITRHLKKTWFLFKREPVLCNRHQRTICRFLMFFLQAPKRLVTLSKRERAHFKHYSRKVWNRENSFRTSSRKLKLKILISVLKRWQTILRRAILKWDRHFQQTSLRWISSSTSSNSRTSN